MKQPIFYVPVALAAAIYLVRMFEIFAKRNTIAGKISENLTLRLFMIIGTVMTFGSVIEYFIRGVGPSWIPVIAGVVCAIISFKLRWAAIAALGKFWSLHVEIRENHEFVQSGPFRFVRHPTYFSMILELLSFCLILGAWWMSLLIPFALIPALMLRLRIEEKALVEKFGETYIDFQRRVPMLIPIKWPGAK